MTVWLERLFGKIWRRIGGRPWIEIIRDEQRQSPLGFLLDILCGHFCW